MMPQQAAAMRRPVVRVGVKVSIRGRENSYRFKLNARDALAARWALEDKRSGKTYEWEDDLIC